VRVKGSVKRGGWWAAVLVACLVLPACADSDAADSSAGKALTVWHYESADSAMAIAWTEAIKQFKAGHPGVKVKVEVKTFEQIRQNAAIVLNVDDPPDVLEYNKGNSTAGALSKQGLLTDLTSEAARRGWDKMLAPSLQTTARYDASGIMGKGAWYGIPNYAEYVMVYYNKDMFAKLGLKVPATLDEFQTVMSAFVKVGIVPLSVGGAEYPAQQIFYELVLSKATRAFVNAFELYQGTVNFNGPQLSFGATTFADWVKRGYIRKDAASVKADDMNAAFRQGRFPMVIVGSWMYGDFVRQITGFTWGTFLFPGNKLHPGSGGNMWVVPAKAKNKKLAFDFIDLTMKPAIQNLIGNSGGVPIATDLARITEPKNRELIANFAAIEASDGLAYYPDWPVPAYYDLLGVALQDLINGIRTPSQVLSDIAKPYSDNLARLRD
jgi:raffinose/stachyose/melibiose transport system substrate-binding protein